MELFALTQLKQIRDGIITCGDTGISIPISFPHNHAIQGITVGDGMYEICLVELLEENQEDEEICRITAYESQLVETINFLLNHAVAHYIAEIEYNDKKNRKYTHLQNNNETNQIR